jgi:phosphosulfolactate synthase (CoM biosynthesis protein A)
VPTSIIRNSPAGSFTLIPTQVVRALIELCHTHNVQVSTGGFFAHVVTQDAQAVERYVATCKQLGFDIVEVASGFTRAVS